MFDSGQMIKSLLKAALGILLAIVIVMQLASFMLDNWY